MKPAGVKSKRDAEVPDVSVKCAGFGHVAQAHDRVHGSKAGLEATRHLLPRARRLALGMKGVNAPLPLPARKPDRALRSAKGS